MRGIFPLKRASQPQTATRIDRLNPLTKNVRFALNSAAPALRTNIGTRATGPGGVGLVSSVDNAFQFERDPTFQNADTTTVQLVLYAPSAPSGNFATRIFGTRGTTQGSSNRRGWEISLDGGSFVDVNLQVFDGSGNRTGSTSGSSYSGAGVTSKLLWATFQVVRTPATNTVLTFWLKTADAAEVTGTVTVASAFGDDTPGVNFPEVCGQIAGAGGVSADFQVLGMVARTGTIGAAERQAYYNNQWQSFAPTQRQILVESAGGAGAALVSTGTTTNSGTASLSTSIALAATGTTSNSGAASLSTAIAFAATGTTSNSGQAALSTSIALAATGTTANSGAASLSTSVGLAATGTTTNSGAAALSTSIALAATGTTSNSATAALTVGSVWQSTGTTTNSATAALSTAIALAAAGTTRNAGVAALTVGIQLAATGTTTNSGTAALSTSVTLAAAGVTKNNGSASLDVGGVWASIGTTRNSAAANLSTAIALAAIGKAICSSSATLSTAIALASQAITRCSGSASLSTGYPFTVGQISITTKMIQKVVRDFILGLTLDPTTNQPQRVVVAPVNRAAMPKPPFVIITPGKINPLATNTHEQVNANLKNVKRSSQFDCQIDCYGPGSGDLADKISILFRDQYAVDVFAASGIDVTPLYASDATQMPLIDGEAQYEERWKIELSMQFNPIVPVAQQSANMLDVGIISVDATYPP